MSPTKFESLPNEILTDLFEKYINGIDVVNAFAFQLNRRIDSLIHTCQRLRFDFVGCHKDDFQICMGLLPAYIDRIEELALSDDKTPGQIHAFLSLYPAFETFPKLRRLFIDAYVPGDTAQMLSRALSALPRTRVDTLTLRVEDDPLMEERYRSWRSGRNEYAFVANLKKLTLSRNIEAVVGNPLPNLQHLTLTEICNLGQCEAILQNAPQLKYLNVPLDVTSVRRRPPSIKGDSPPVFPLQTLIVKVVSGDELDQLKSFTPFLEKMPRLQRLELTGDQTMADANTWHTILTQSLKCLDHFRLAIASLKTASGETESPFEALQTTFDAFQTPFWTEKKNFQVIFTGKTDVDKYRNTLLAHRDLCEPFWVIPESEDAVRITSNPTPVLFLTELCKPLLTMQQFTQVTTLVIEDITVDLCPMINKHLPQNHVRHLAIADHDSRHEPMAPILSLFPNLETLVIPFPLLFPTADHRPARNEKLRSLDLSETRHPFNEQIVANIHHAFPNLQHVSIHTEELENVSRFESLMPRLRSLKFRMLNRRPSTRYGYSSEDAEYEFKSWIYKFWHRTNFCFHVREDSMTVWLGHDDLKKEKWVNIYDARENRSSLQNNRRISSLMGEWFDFDSD